MIKKLLFITSLLILPIVVQAASTSSNLSVVVGPSGSVTTPAAAAAAGFTTLALNSDFSVQQPAGWFGCLGDGPGRTWYQGREGGDYGGQVSCNANLSTGRFTLLQDAAIGKQVLNLKFLPSDIVEPGGARIHYTTIQTVDDITQPEPNCCQHGVVFPSNYYMEATYKIKNTPFVPFNRMSGIWWGFWQGGEGVPPGSRWPTLEVDHPEQHGEDPGEIGDNVLNWKIGGGEAFPPPWGPRADSTDFTQYHTFGVRSQVTGSNSLFICGYIDNQATGCNSYPNLADGQVAERKYMILFVGLQCFASGGVVTAECINKTVVPWQCGSEICVWSTTDIIRRTDHDYFFHLSGVTGGGNNPNGSWPAAGIDARNWRLVGSSWAGGYSNGTVNVTQGVDLMIQNVRVWSCSSWQSTNC
jgi:hypothetical protein